MSKKQPEAAAIARRGLMLVLSSPSGAGKTTLSRMLLADGGPAGRRLDFLAQELNRESNTLTAKANDVELTNIGLELKSVVEQFREQVQNLE